MGKNKKAILPKLEAEAYDRFMANNLRRLDFGLDPIIVMPGVAGIRIATTVEEAKKVVLKWKADKEFRESAGFKIEQEITELKRKMSLTTHLTRQTAIYTVQLDSLTAKLEEFKNEARIHDNGRAMGEQREGPVGGVSGEETPT